MRSLWLFLHSSVPHFAGHTTLCFTALEKELHLRIDCVHTEYRNFIDEYIRCCRVTAEQCVREWC